MYNAGTAGLAGTSVLGASLAMPESGEQLAFTGSTAAGIALLAIALIVLGLMAVGAAGRRRTR